MPHATSPEVSKVAYLDTGGIVWLDAPDAWSKQGVTTQAGVVLVPSEQVRLSCVDLPLSSHRQRRSALPFAVEESLAEPLSNVHVVLGPEVSQRCYLSAVVGHELMADWVASLHALGLSQCRLVPDVLAVPKPPQEAWSVWVLDQRALVRRADGSGFALAVNALTNAWKLAGEPRLIHHAGPLAAELSAQAPEAGPESDIVVSRFDLRQGVYARSVKSRRRSLKLAGVLLLAGLVGHAIVASIDTLALQRIAEDRRAEAQALLSDVAPQLRVDGNIDSQLARLLPDGAESPGRFLPLLSRVSDTLKPLAEGLAVQTMTYSAVDNTLSLDLQASDLAALQRIEAAFSDAGLQATSGVATAGGGGAQARIVISDNMSSF